jgi:hypothetical protein
MLTKRFKFLTGDSVMSERIDQFCENLRIKLTSMDDNMQALKAKIDKQAQTAEKDARAQLDAVNKRMEQERAKVTAAENDMKKWADERKVATSEKIAEWKAKLEKAKLRSRAENAEGYAAAAAVVAMAALDAAEQASLEAWLARKDADSAQGKAA